jgi:hypothetical protein
MTPINSPVWIDREISLSAVTPGNPKEAWSNRMIGSWESGKESGSFPRGEVELAQ